jgi:hypothetical protein
MIFDLINNGADPISVLALVVLAFVCGFSIARIIYKGGE